MAKRKRRTNNDEFPDVPTPGRTRLLHLGVGSLMFLSLILTVLVPDNPALMTPTIILWFLTAGALLLIVLDKVNVGRVDVYLAPRKESSLLICVVMFFAFFIIAQAPQSAGVVQSYIETEGGFLLVGGVASSASLISLLAFSQLNVFSQSVWFNGFPIALSRKITKQRFAFAGVGAITTAIFYIPLAMLFSAMIAPIFHVESHQIDVDNLERVIPSALLFALWSFIGIVFGGVDISYFCHSGFNAGVLSSMLLTVVVAGEGTDIFTWLFIVGAIIVVFIIAQGVLKKK